MITLLTSNLLIMSKKQPYFPNNWKAFRDTPAEWFDSISFDEFMDWKIGGYEIPSSIACIIREQNLKTGKVKEHVYQRASAAKSKVRALMDKGESEFTVANHDALHFLTPKAYEDYDDPLA